MIGRPRAGSWLEKIRRFLELLRAESRDLTRDLCVVSVPDGAAFRIHPKSLPADERTTATDALISNLYLGLYAYRVEREGYKPAAFEANLLREPQPTLECRLVAERGREAALPCRFRPAPAAACAGD